MQIKGKVHCFFEQSGTFKNEFIKLGIPAEDYDIQNNFGETDHVIDLFGEIDRAYDNLTRQDKTRQDNFRHNQSARPYCRFLSLYIFLCTFSNAVFYELCKLSLSFRFRKNTKDFRENGE